MNYASIGFTYDAERDAFIAPQPYPSWVFDEATCQWWPPVAYPGDLVCAWDEEKVTWVELDSIEKLI